MLRAPTVDLTDTKQEVAGHVWQAGAAYLYLLQLDGSALAWEFLRRNPKYREAYLCRPTQRVDPVAKWSLFALENPDLDGRCVHPLWWTPADESVRLTKDPEAPPGSNVFSIWRVAGQPTLCHDGRSLVLKTTVDGRPARIVIPRGLSDGDPYVFVIRMDANAKRHWRAALDCDDALRGRVSRQLRVSGRSALRTDIAHMRSLQALDGWLVGASQRAIAVALFGSRRVADSWHADGELRAQLRYLLRRGRALMCGGYLALVHGGFSRPSDTQCD